MSAYVASFPSPIGTVCVRADERGITSVAFVDEAPLPVPVSPPFVADCVEQLREYFRGTRRVFADLPLVIHATDFQRSVWDATSEIPCGSTATYGDLARTIGSPDAARAVGMALNRNSIAIIIPCHRIVSARSSQLRGGKPPRLTLSGIALRQAQGTLLLQTRGQAPWLPSKGEGGYAWGVWRKQWLLHHEQQG